MAAPYTSQLYQSLRKTLMYTAPGGSTASIEEMTVQEGTPQSVYPGFPTLWFRDDRLTAGLAQQPVRPQEGGTYGDGTVTWRILGVTKRELLSFYEILGRAYNVPDGLISGTATLAHRDNTRTTAAGLSDPTWNQYASGPCLFMPDQQAANLGDEDAVTTNIAGRVVMAGFVEMRAGDRFTLSAVDWTVESFDPFDPSFGAQAFRVVRRI